jgi:hypothetical protein
MWTTDFLDSKQQGKSEVITTLSQFDLEATRQEWSNYKFEQ